MSCRQLGPRFSPWATSCRWCICSGRCAMGPLLDPTRGGLSGWNGRPRPHRPPIILWQPRCGRRRPIPTANNRRKHALAEQRTTPAQQTVLADQFDDLAQQYEASNLGMWVFLLTEMMFFGAVFVAYTVYR